ncbi:lytic transglycosylase domain-containing protein [Pedobacter sp. SYP-B3415]|uniref:lytic transglycosylase domain-containing protein n=1 Tax=Pedobacter sp. SYP-B3415 TaxID=2496641 RepID=UPI0035156577
MPQAKKPLPKEEKITKKATARVVKKAPARPYIAQFSFADENLPAGDRRVEKKLRKTLSAHAYGKLQTNLLHVQAAKWFPVIEPILAAYGIPNDFKYIALVESGLKVGISPKGAAGIWQFMPQTARNYGLKVNRHVDERHNLRKSTVAACRYIRELYGIFDSWTLVAAAYNVGDVRLMRQIHRQNQDNYYKMRLNRETGAYVYKLISMKQILEDPVKYGYDKGKSLLAMNNN